jgi:hypothetical protein
LDTASGSIVDEPVLADLSGDEDQSDIAVLRKKMVQRYDVGDYSGALDVSLKIIEIEPENLDALHYEKSCKEKLLSMYESRIGDMAGVPVVSVTNHELMWRNLDPSAGFILSRIDGIGTYEDIIDISGLSRFDTCKILSQLLQDGLISSDDR